jgi:tetratricopeptide (TPR) repeat protein
VAHSEERYRAAIRANPVHAHAHLELGQLVWERRRSAEALDLIGRAAEIDPQLAQDALERVQAGARDQVARQIEQAKRSLDAGLLDEAATAVAAARETATDGESLTLVDSVERQVTATRRLEAAKLALDRGDYAAALMELDQRARLVPEDDASRQLRADAERLRESTSLLEAAEVAYRQRDLPRAEDLLKDAAGRASDANVGLQLQERIAQAREADSLVAEARAALEAGQLSSARALLDRAERLDDHAPGLSSLRLRLDAEAVNIDKSNARYAIGPFDGATLGLISVIIGAALGVLSAVWLFLTGGSLPGVYVLVFSVLLGALGMVLRRLARRDSPAPPAKNVRPPGPDDRAG